MAPVVLYYLLTVFHLVLHPAAQRPHVPSYYIPRHKNMPLSMTIYLEVLEKTKEMKGFLNAEEDFGVPECNKEIN